MSNYVPQLVAQRFINTLLTSDNAVTTAIGGANKIYPNIGPATLGQVRHLSHVFAGPEGGIRATPMGQPMVQIGVRWDIIGWEPSYSQQTLESTMLAAKDVLIGTNGRGKRHIFPDGVNSYRIEVVEFGPVPVEVQPEAAGVWAPVSERYVLTIRQAA